MLLRASVAPLVSAGFVVYETTFNSLFASAVIRPGSTWLASDSEDGTITSLVGTCTTEELLKSTELVALRLKVRGEDFGGDFGVFLMEQLPVDRRERERRLIADARPGAREEPRSGGTSLPPGSTVRACCEAHRRISSRWSATFAAVF